MPPDCVSSFTRSKLLTRMAEHASRLWVCFTRLEPLMRMAEHPSRLWVPLKCFIGSVPLTRMAAHPQRVSPFAAAPLIRMAKHSFSEWVPQHCFTRLEPLNTPPGCEFLSTDSPGLSQNHWTPLQRVSPSQNHWWDWLITCPVGE